METPIEGPAATPDPVEEEDRAEGAAVMARVRGFAVAAWVIFAVFTLISRDFRAFIGLTCSALVAIINFLWLEDLIVKLLQPAPRVSAWRLGFRTLARFAVLGAALTVAIFIARFDALSVLLGFSVIVVGIMTEAVWSTWRSFTAKS